MGVASKFLNIKLHIIGFDLLMSGLTKKVIYADKTLAEILNVDEGVIVSYSELLKGLHRYIKEKGLKNTGSIAAKSTEPPATVPEALAECRDCNEPIPVGALFCDMCGVRQ